jgi:hypothetical protein
VEDDPAKAHLDVYDTKDGLWNPELGELELPEGWDFLPSGDAFVTRQVKRAGDYWLAWLPRTRNRRHRTAIGVFAPSEAIEAAQAKAAETDADRAIRRAVGARYRERKEDRYRQELADAIVGFVAFVTTHAKLASSIAESAAARAGEVGSGRVGRTRTLSIEERAALAARAHIRHHHTEYEARLDDVPLDDLYGDDWLYREAKAQAHADVDAFIDAHRVR